MLRLMGACTKLLSPLHLQTLSLSSRKTMATLSSLSLPPQKQKVIVIAGPTGVGKSRLALELAKRLNGEIISADSVTVYQGLDIGSAKPSLFDRAEVAHHLLDIMHPSEDYSVGDFYRDARAATELVLHKGRVPIVTGGTGLYLRWYMYGKPGVPKATSEVTALVRAEMEGFQRKGDWYEGVELIARAGDPTARDLPVNDWYRLRRKLEIVRSAGLPPSAFPIPYDEFHTDLDARDLDYDFVCIFLTMPRVELYRSIDSRCEEMVRNPNFGLLSEASWLLDIGLKPGMNSATRAIGYRQAMEYLSNCRVTGGKSSAEYFYEFLSSFQKSSRNFAKRQSTWFRNEKAYFWVDASKNFEEIVGFVCDCYYEGKIGREVPKELEMRRRVISGGNKEECKEMKLYKTQNKFFVKPEDFEGVLDWIEMTQGRCAALVEV